MKSVGLSPQNYYFLIKLKISKLNTKLSNRAASQLKYIEQFYKYPALFFSSHA